MRAVGVSITRLKRGAALGAAAWAAVVALPVQGATPPALSVQPSIAPSLVETAPPAARPARHPARLAAPRPAPKPEPEPRWELTQADIDRYKRIFAVQKQGDWATADRLIAELGNRILMGHVLYQRYMHPTAYYSQYSELRRWLQKYGDHPGAENIYRLAVSRRPEGAPAPPRPQLGTRFHGSLEAVMLAAPRYESQVELSRYQRNRKRELRREMRELLDRGWITATAKRLDWKEVQSYFDDVERDRLRGDIAAGYYFRDYVDKALRYARQARNRTASMAPRAMWIGGLAAWRKGNLDEAAVFFEAVAESDASSAWRRAAGGYWAARAHLRRGRPAEVSRWLRVAANYPRTFYGLLGRRALGMEIDFNWELPDYNAGHRRIITRSQRGTRALALIQVDAVARAERELRYLEPRGNKPLQRALFALAKAKGLPGLALELGGAVATADGRLFDGALYPRPPWKPQSGYRVDPALLFAFMRRESRFDPWATSSAGAKGLMQLMPATANFVGDENYRGPQGELALRNPRTNVRLGQKYLLHLLDHRLVQGNLFRLAAAYNGGPGNLQKWDRRLDFANDPLLFLESIPLRETRIFVERVLTNLWIYRLRMGQPTPSLNAIAGGRAPQYVALNDGAGAQAQVAASDAGQ